MPVLERFEQSDALLEEDRPALRLLIKLAKQDLLDLLIEATYEGSYRRHELVDFFSSEVVGAIAVEEWYRDRPPFEFEAEHSEGNYRIYSGEIVIIWDTARCLQHHTQRRLQQQARTLAA